MHSTLRDATTTSTNCWPQLEPTMKIDYKLERVFPLMFLIIGITFFVSGLLLLGTFNSNAKAGPVILIIGTVIIFTRKGTLIDFNDRRIKHYIGLFFIKIGSG